VSIGGGLQDPDEPLGGRGNKQGLKRPTHVFAGTIGILEADASILGKLKILYKSYPGGRVNCRFEPGDASSLDIVDGVATLSDWEYTCRGKHSIGTFSGMADLVVVGADDSTNMGPKAGHTKDRGSICVVADVAELDLGDACGEAADALPLDPGRARVGSTDGGAPSDGGVPQ
jgi:hypothetical protein